MNVDLFAQIVLQILSCLIFLEVTFHYKKDIFDWCGVAALGLMAMRRVSAFFIEQGFDIRMLELMDRRGIPLVISILMFFWVSGMAYRIRKQEGIK